MMTKKQSKKMNQLKYLVLIPMLVSMLFYTSCSEDAIKGDLIQKKELQTMYVMFKNDKLETIETREKFTYLDVFVGTKFPKEFKEISLKEFSKEEKNEFLELKTNYRKLAKNSNFEDFRFFEIKNGRRVFGSLINSDEEIIEEKEEVSFMVIDKAPTFPGCESGDKDCFSTMVQKHFAKNFDADLPNALGLSPGKKRVFISFKINKEGKIIDVQARAPHETIKEEVLRVMNALPVMIPGENEGITVAVKYSIPFTLIVGEDHTEGKTNNKINNDSSTSFFTVDKAPTFPGCDSGDKDCFSKEVQKHFGKNFDSKLVNNLGLESGRTRIFVGINITTNGNIDQIKIKADHPELENEVRRVMQLLPNITPGEDNGKTVAVKYSIPFTLIVE